MRSEASPNGPMLGYLPWYQAVQYLDRYAPGCGTKSGSVAEPRDLCVVTVRIAIPGSEGKVCVRPPELSLDVKGYGDPVSNAASTALRRCAAHFGLCLSLYEK
ncbi:MAG: hypothetical protein J2P21_27005 [Chloracidobacterium sp.]|nr:hypothetical protein [Chloracidobacterium sp.]